MNHRLYRIVTSGLLVAAAACVFVAPAEAAGSWTVKIGTSATGSGTHIDTGTQVRFTDVNTGTVITCASSTLIGSVPHLGSGLSGTGLFTITGSTFTNCTTGSPGSTFTISQTGTISFNGASVSANVATGTLTNILLKFSASGCAFAMTGTSDAGYSNSTHLLDINAVSGSGHGLAINNVSGCFGSVNNGDTAQGAGNYSVAAKTTSGTTGALSLTQGP